MNTIHQRATELANSGISIMPIHEHDETLGDKRPALSWKRLQQERLTPAETDQWFTNGDYGIGVVMGAISGDLMMIELEGRAATHLAELTTLTKDSGLDHLWQRMFGWCEITPSGGYHWYLYAPGNTHGNRKLARNTAGEVIAETRENGGYSVVAPLDGEHFHHTRQGAWKNITGGPSTAGTFTPDELDDLLAIFQTLDETPHADTPTYTPPADRDPHDGITPGDDYETKTSWTDILAPHGWEIVHQRGTETFWRRPGKTHGISASTGHANDRDRLYVWSSSTDFNPETPYTKFAAYTLLEHNGDYTAAAKHLASKGYGKQAEHPRDTTGLDTYINQLANRSETPNTPTPSPEINEPDTYTRTDDGNALRFADTNKGHLRYIPETNSWAAWNGHQWAREESNASAIEAAKTIARNLPTDDKADEKHKQHSLSRNGIQSIVTLASSINGIYTPINQFDNDPYTLNTPAGTVNLKTGKLTPPNPNTLCLRSTTVAPDWTTKTPRWHDFLADTFAGQPELTNYMQRFIGMSLIGRVLEQTLSFWNGAGANGKSTALNTTQKIIGIGDTGYSISVQPDIFIKGRHEHLAELAQLQGVRLAVTAETAEGQKFDESRVKLLTGSDLISARFMRGNFFTFDPSHTFIMVSNHEPEVQSGGSAFWRRVKKLPFNNIVPPEQRNPHLEEQLLEEAPGILAWLIDGARHYLNDGLQEPAAVKVATTDYEKDQDTVRVFTEEMCTIGNPDIQGFQIPVARMYDTYELWCRQNAFDPVAKQTLTKRLRAYGVTTPRSNQSRFYGGIRLNETAVDDLNTALEDY